MATRITPSLHDWNIYAVRWFAEAEILELHAEWYPYGSATELVDVRFEGVRGQSFEHVLSGNIVFDLVELEAADCVERWREFLVESMPYGTPDCFGTKIDGLAAWLADQRQRCFELSSSHGMHGFVIARDVRITPRETRLVPAP